MADPIGYGYPVIVLPQVCEVYLKARDAGTLLPSQQHIAERAKILIHGLATVGIIALVDEVTGYAWAALSSARKHPISMRFCDQNVPCGLFGPTADADVDFAPDALAMAYASLRYARQGCSFEGLAQCLVGGLM